MTANNVRLLLLLLACWQLVGCSQWRYDLGTPLYSIELPRPEDNISLADALALFGPPLRMSAADSGFVLAWEHWHIRENSLGVSLGVMGADFFSADWGEMRAKGEFVLLTFDRQHRLTSASRSDWDNYGGGGKAIQPLASFVSVVDAGDLTVFLPQHRWGAAFLQPLPEATNIPSSPNSGQSGLEQRGTPTTIGQRALELH